MISRDNRELMKKWNFQFSESINIIVTMSRDRRRVSTNLIGGIIKSVDLAKYINQRGWPV